MTPAGHRSPGSPAAGSAGATVAKTTRAAATRNPADDARLMRRVADGDGGALEALYDRYSRPCASLARRLLGDQQLAQDAVQDVFMALWRDPAKFDPERGAFSSWLLSMTHHKAVDVVRREENLRKRRANSDVLLTREDDGPRTDDAVWQILRAERVREGLGTLPPVQREALVLAYFGGYTQREIAGITATPLGTVKTRMLAGMRRLRDTLDASVNVSDSPYDSAPSVNDNEATS